MFKRLATNQLSSLRSIRRVRFSSTSTQNKNLIHIRLETKEDIDIKFEDESYYLSKELKRIEDDKIRLYILS